MPAQDLLGNAQLAPSWIRNLPAMTNFSPSFHTLANNNRIVDEIIDAVFISAFDQSADELTTQNREELEKTSQLMVLSSLIQGGITEEGQENVDVDVSDIDEMSFEEPVDDQEF